MTQDQPDEYLKTCICELIGGFEAAGRVCGVSGKAVQKWVKAGRLPRTEATGETHYVALLVHADPRIDAKRLRACAVYHNPEPQRARRIA